MKDSEFLELLNLYVDHEITTDQAARLEAAVAADQRRRKLYRQYCMLHKGCSLLTGAVAESAPLPSAVRGGRRESSAAEDARSFWGWSGVFAGGGLAAAALVVLFATLHLRQGTAAAPSAPSVAAVSPAPVVARAAAAALPAPGLAAANSGDMQVAMSEPHAANFPSPFGSGDLQTAFNTHAWSAPVGSVEPMGMAPGNALAWLDQVKLSPVGPRDGFNFLPTDVKDSAMLLPIDAASVPVNVANPNDKTERAAFQVELK